MRLIMLWCALLIFSVPAWAQDELPRHFVWLGAGIDSQPAEGDDLMNGIYGYGIRITDRQYVISNVVMTSEYSTISQAFMQVITHQKPVTLFALGELGVESGSGSTNLSLGAGIGVEIGMEIINKKLKNFGFIGAVKLMKNNQAPEPNGGYFPPGGWNHDHEPESTRTRYVTGVVYKFGN